MVNTKGQSLLEVIIAMAIFALISAAMASLSVGGFVSLSVGGEQTEAQVYAQEGVEAVRAIRDRAWNELIFTTSTVSTSSGQWVFDGEGTIGQSGAYTRTISVWPVCRDGSNNIADCPATYTDIQTKKVISRVDLPVRNTTNTVQQVTYLTNWDSLNWTQTDWTGGNGQNIWSNVNKYESDDGNVDFGTAGEMKLKNAGSSCGTKSWSFDNSADYTYTPSKITVTSSVARLESSGTAGIDANTVGIWHLDEASGNFIDSSSNAYHLDNLRGTAPTYNQSGKFSTSVNFNGNGARYRTDATVPNLRITGNITVEAWVYKTAAAVSQQSIVSKWDNSALNRRAYNLTLDSNSLPIFYVSPDGTSSVASRVTSSIALPLNSWVHLAGVYDGSKLYIFVNGVLQGSNNYSGGISNQPADFFIGAAVQFEGVTAYFDGKIDEVRVSNTARWTSGFTPPASVYAASSYPSDSPTINPVAAHTVSGIAAWSSFVETATKNGGEVSYQLSSDGGSTWKYWSGSAWATAGATNYNTASVINTNIGSFTTTTAQIMFKAFLSGDGTQQVILDNVQISCEKQYDWPFTTAGDYTYNSAKITVASGKASLVDQGGGGSCGGIPSACTTFGTSPLCAAQNNCLWGGGTSGSSPAWSTTWGTYADWEDGARASGSSPTTGGNPTNYKDIALSRNNAAGTASGYWQQSFTTTANNPETATINFNWSIKSYNGTFLTSYIIYVFVDNFAGAPTIGTQVWSQNVTSLTGWATVSNLNVASKLTTAGTYYIKLVARRIKPTGNPPNTNNTVGWDNVSLTWTKNNSCSGTHSPCSGNGNQSTCTAQTCTWTGAALYPTDKPTISASTSLSIATTSLDRWSTFVETATKNGGEIYYQLSDNDGSTWQYWNGVAWTTAGGSNYNIATDINTNISTFPTSTGKLMVKAFLSSNGSQLVELDNVRVGWGEGSSSGYASTAYFISSAYNMSNSSPVQILSWNEDVGGCATCDVKLQLRVAPDSGGSPGVWSGWYGVGGLGTYYADPAKTLLSTTLNWRQWVQYRAELIGDGVGTPIFRDMTVNYK